MSADTGGNRGAADTSKSSDLRLRTFSAALMMPPAIAVSFFGGIYYTLGVALLGFLLLREWCAITSFPSRKGLDWVLGVGLGAVLIAAGSGYAAYALGGLIAIVVLAIGARMSGHASGWLAVGVSYLGLACLSMIVLRHGEAGRIAVLLVLTIVWATDIGAYFTGRTLGGPKLWPAVSPKKTWSGSLGGLVWGVGAGIVLSLAFDIPVEVRTVLIMGFLSIATQIGDLMESAFKRAFSVKDSGSLIPGHGGVLDRLDGLLLAAIAAALIGGIEAGFLSPAGGLGLGV